ncbi:fatty acid-binding protein, heart-like [Plodia interpunctella]|uniref:fatty acid-binding protein, heart-like n=1 Tax=Plodia interpunctella TaxID=58824 RepID=UPI002367F1A8|nr:fatty acid-binding protein, heart-like [Plodia interpunctella]
MEEFFGKKYVLTKHENFEDYLSHIGVGYIGRKLALTLKLVQSLSRNEDGTYLFNIHTTIFNWDIVFTPGVEYDEKKPDGTVIRAIMTLEGNVLTHIQKHAAGRHATHVIEFFPDKNIIKTTAQGFDKTCTRYYKLVE